MPREIFGVPPHETPAGIFPPPPIPAPPASVIATPTEPRRPPVPTGAIASSTTVIRPIELHDENET